MSTPVQVASQSILVGQTAAELAAQVRAGTVAAAEVVEAHLSRIATIDPQLGAFEQLRAGRALEEAATLQSLGLPLAGVPIAIKDNVTIRGESMRNGSRATPHAVAGVDHPVVARLRAAGAVLLGTTRVPELCVWGDCDAALGTTRNPWDLTRTSGGSSGGSAAAVAAALVPLALGADGMGSIRIPAACCGIVGIKPGAGVVPSMLGISSWFGMAENGALATTVQDAALMLSVLADRPEFRMPGVPMQRLRIAVSTRPPLHGVRVDRESEAAVFRTAEALTAEGHHVERADPPRPSPRAVISMLAHWFAGAAQEAGGWDERMLERRARTHVRLGRLAERLGLRRAQDRANWQMLNVPFFRRFDLLITPVLAGLPPRAEWSRRSWTATMWTETRFAPFPAPWNFAGYPAASIPAGIHSSGMPLSVQLVAATGGELTILSVARQLEILRPWPRHAPVRI